jgi:hypothetical protein
MKKYLVAIALVIGLLGSGFLVAKSFDKDPKCKAKSCCAKCKDTKCKTLCTTYENMTEEQKASEEGKKVKEECLAICKEKKCCSKEGTCPSMSDEKSCCKKK